MDRVLLVYEDINEVTHVEATLRKVGFDIESIPNEFNLSEKLLSFNPDVIVAHGRGHRVQTINIGKKLKESYRYMGKIVLIFQPSALPSPSDLLKIRMDVKIVAPISTILLAKVLLKLTGRDQENVIDKLTRIAQTDISFRSQESSLLSGTGKSVDTELSQLSNDRNNEGIFFLDDTTGMQRDRLENPQVSGAQVENPGNEVADFGVIVPEDLPNSHQERGKQQVSENVAAISNSSSQPSSAQKIIAEMEEVKASLPLRIAAYSKAIQSISETAEIEGFPQPPPSGPLNKKAARRRQKELLKNVSQDELDTQDRDRREFAVALVNKKQTE